MPSYLRRFVDFPDQTVLACTRLTDDGPVILLAKDINVPSFFAYLKGEINSPTSQQKAIVLERVAQAGFPLEQIEALIGSKETVERFLVLHELSHINHNDQVVYKSKRDLLDPEILEVETRATLEALTQIQAEPKTHRPDRRLQASA